MFYALKQKLARVSKKSKRYQLVKSIWFRDSYSYTMRNHKPKACSFYWFYLPTSIIAWILVGIASIVFFLIMIPVSIIAWMFGVWPTFFERKHDDNYQHKSVDFPIFYEHGYNPISGKKQKIHPIYIIGPVLAILFVLFVPVPWVWVAVGAVIGIILCGIGVGLAWFFTRHSVRKGWDRLCPPLEVIEK